jgi:hypothetical protein
MKKMLDDAGLVAEFTAPRMWEDPRGVDAGFTSNNADVRKWAIDRTKRCIDIAAALGIKFVGCGWAREGTYIREAKNAIDCAQAPARRAQRAARARQGGRDRHRAQAQRADGPRLHPHDRPRAAHRQPHERPEARWAA